MFSISRKEALCGEEISRGQLIQVFLFIQVAKYLALEALTT